MYRPTARVLTVLELLQSRAAVGSAELAMRLEVDARTVRSYIATLRDMGIPVEARPGRHGGYQLRPGFRLPPLMLTNDEAVAAALGLLFARRAGLGGAAPATEGALAKLDRVLPETLRAQLRALAAALIVDPPESFARGVDHAPIPPAATLLDLATAATAARRVTLTYRDRDGAETTRPFDPYAMVYAANAAWYTVGHCHLRGAVRVFRIDRVVRVEPTETPFERPADLDPRALVRRSLAHVPAPWAVELALDASREEIQSAGPRPSS